jgi:hypothetical protein
MLKFLSTYLIVRGVLVLIFAVYAFMDAVVQAVRAFSGLRAGAANARILIAFGVVLVGRPDVAVSLAVIYGIFSLAFRITVIVLGMRARRAVGTVRLLDHLITVVSRGGRSTGRWRGAGVVIGSDARSWLCNGRKVVTWL